MQRRLIIMRHAKSAWDSEALTDHERPLNQRGRDDAPRIARELVARGWEPTHILSSDSRRTRETCERMLTQLSGQPEVHFLQSLYHADLQDIESAVAMLPDHVQTVLALGHNPGWERAVFLLTGQSVTLTTANAALLTIDANHWAAAIEQRVAWELVDILRPKELDDD